MFFFMENISGFSICSLIIIIVLERRNMLSFLNIKPRNREKKLILKALPWFSFLRLYIVYGKLFWIFRNSEKKRVVKSGIFANKSIN